MDFLLNNCINAKIIVLVITVLLIADEVNYEEKYYMSGYLFLIATLINIQAREEEIIMKQKENIHNKSLEQQLKSMSKELDVIKEKINKLNI
jgi:hypothetical protein